MNWSPRNNPLPVIIAMVTAQIALHLIPFLLYGPHPLGYDTGFYRRYIIQPLHAIPNAAVPGLGGDALLPRILLDTLRLIHLPIDFTLYGSYIGLWAAISVALWMLIKHYFGNHVAHISAFLFAFSSIQYTAYWYMLWKNALATTLMLIVFLLIEKQRSLWVTLPISLAIILSHQTTSVIFLFTLAIFFGLEKEKRRYAAILFVTNTTLFLYIYMHLGFHYLTKFPTAVFMDRREYFMLTLPLLLLATLIPREELKKISRTVVGAFSVATFSFAVFALPFYQRIFMFSDIGMIVAAALGISAIWKLVNNRVIPDSPTGRFQSLRERRITEFGLAILLAICIGWYLGNLTLQIKKLQPFISRATLEGVYDIQNAVPAEATILTSTIFAPWVQGWSLNRVKASGLLGDNHPAQDWVAFWNSPNAEVKKSFLNSFPKPLYLFIDPSQRVALAPISQCFEEKTRFILLYQCN